MSGPKVDHAELERRRREALEEERRRTVRRIQAGISACYTVFHQIDRLSKEIQASNKTKIKMAENEASMEQVVMDYKMAQSDALMNLKKIRNKSIPTTPEAIEKMANELQAALETQKRAYEEQVEEEEKRLKEHWDNVSKQKAFEEFSKAVEMANRQDGEILLDFESVKEQIEQLTGKESNIREKASLAIDEIIQLFNEEDTSRENQRILLNHAKIIGTAVNEKTELIKSSVEVFELAKVKIKKENRIFHMLYEEYLTEYVVCMDILNQSRTERFPIIPKSKKQFSSMEALEQEIQLVKEVAKYTHEQNYIKEQMNEVMRMFGYDLCQDVVLDEYQTGHHYLCKELAGNDAIHVHVSDNNQIMMEIVSTKESVRTEITSSNVNAIMQGADALSESVIDELVEKQGYFCHIHPEIVKELSKRGVLLSEKVYREPSVKYCKQIVNLVGAECEGSVLAEKEENILNGVQGNMRRRKKTTLKRMEIK